MTSRFHIELSSDLLALIRNIRLIHLFDITKLMNNYKKTSYEKNWDYLCLQTWNSHLNVVYLRTIVENCEVAITYTNTSGQVASRAVAPSELSTVIDDAQPKSSFKYVSSYLPEKHAMDRFTVTSAELYFPE